MDPFAFVFMTYGPIYALDYGIWGSLFQHIKVSKAPHTGKFEEKYFFCLWHIRQFIFLFMTYGHPHPHPPTTPPLTGPHKYPPSLAAKSSKYQLFIEVKMPLSRIPKLCTQAHIIIEFQNGMGMFIFYKIYTTSVTSLYERNPTMSLHIAVFLHQ